LKLVGAVLLLGSAVPSLLYSLSVKTRRDMPFMALSSPEQLTGSVMADAAGEQHDVKSPERHRPVAPGPPPKDFQPFENLVELPAFTPEHDAYFIGATLTRDPLLSKLLVDVFLMGAKCVGGGTSFSPVQDPDEHWKLAQKVMTVDVRERKGATFKGLLQLANEYVRVEGDGEEIEAVIVPTDTTVDGNVNDMVNILRFEVPRGIAAFMHQYQDGSLQVRSRPPTRVMTMSSKQMKRERMKALSQLHVGCSPQLPCPLQHESPGAGAGEAGRGQRVKVHAQLHLANKSPHNWLRRVQAGGPGGPGRLASAAGLSAHVHPGPALGLREPAVGDGGGVPGVPHAHGRGPFPLRRGLGLGLQGYEAIPRE
jgi:hypothetical protein